MTPTEQAGSGLSHLFAKVDKVIQRDASLMHDAGKWLDEIRSQCASNFAAIDRATYSLLNTAHLGSAPPPRNEVESHCRRILLVVWLLSHPEEDLATTPPLTVLQEWAWGRPFEELTSPLANGDQNRRTASRQFLDPFLHFWIRECESALRSLYPELLQVAEESRSTTPTGDGRDAYEFRQVGQMWQLTFGEEHGIFEDARGFHHLNKLLRHPNPIKPWSETDLLGLEPHAFLGNQLTQPVLDATAIKEYRDNLAEYDAEIEEAQRIHDSAKADQLRREKDEVAQHLRDAIGHNHTIRDLAPNPKTSAQNSIRQAIKRARVKFSSKMPKMDQHLEEHITVKPGCYSYRPTGTPPKWELD